MFTPGGEVVVEPLDILVVVAPKKRLEEVVKVLLKGKLTSRGVTLKRKIKERLNGLE